MLVEKKFPTLFARKKSKTFYLLFGSAWEKNFSGQVQKSRLIIAMGVDFIRAAYQYVDTIGLSLLIKSCWVMNVN